MKLHELKPSEGSRKTRNRVGRGIGSGNGIVPKRLLAKTKSSTIVNHLSKKTFCMYFGFIICFLG